MLIAVLPCALSGCWEEIHYSPPSGTGPVAAAPASEARQSIETSDAAASDFGDDVADSLAEEPELPAAGADESASVVVDAELSPEPNSPTDSAVSTSTLPNSRLAAWSLGSTLSLAALANDRAASEDKVAGWFETARQQATALGTTVADLPPRPAADQVDMEGTRAMEYLLAQGQSVGAHLATSLGIDHSALFEVALKSNLLLVRYEPGAKFSEMLAASIGQASERAKLPPELVQPVLQAVEAKSPVKDVRDAVFDMHEHVDRFLSTGQL